MCVGVYMCVCEYVCGVCVNMLGACVSVEGVYWICVYVSVGVGGVCVAGMCV